jgi:hypothetical protein
MPVTMPEGCTFRQPGECLGSGKPCPAIDPEKAIECLEEYLNNATNVVQAHGTRADITQRSEEARTRISELIRQG